MQAAADAKPDFAVVYAFLGSLFHQGLDGMDHQSLLCELPVRDKSTLQLLLGNLAAALCRPDTIQLYKQARP